VRLDAYDACDLYAAMANTEDAEDDDAMVRMETKCMAHIGIDFEQLAAIAELLLPLCTQAQLAISGDTARGFAKNGAFICKMVDPE
jgi:hypothetical protein